jgi:hypothetical protein
MKKIELTEREWDLLDRLTDKAGMDWFLTDTTDAVYKGDVLVSVEPKGFLTEEQAKSASDAFLPENVAGFKTNDLLDVFAIFKRAGVADNYMKDVLVDALLAGRK